MAVTRYNFTYADRAALVADGWDFIGRHPVGTPRDTEYGAVTYTGSAIQIPMGVGDLWATLDNTRDSLFRSLPSDWTSVRHCLSAAPSKIYQQTGIAIYETDGMYAQIVLNYNTGDGLHLSVVRERIGDGPSVTGSLGWPFGAAPCFLRIDRGETDGSGFTDFDLYAADADEDDAWLHIGTVNLDLDLSTARFAVITGADESSDPGIATHYWSEVHAPISVPFDHIQLFDGGTGAPDATTLTAGARGDDLGDWRLQLGVTVDHTAFEDHDIGVYMPVAIAVAGASYDGSAPGGVTFDHTGSPEESDVLELGFTASTYETMQVMGLVRLDLTNDTDPNDYNADLLAFASTVSGSFGVAQVQHNYLGNLAFRAHAPGANGRLAAGTTGQWVRLCLSQDRSTGFTEVVAVDSATDAVIGSSVGTDLTGGYLHSFCVQDYLRYPDVNKTGSIKVKLVALREDISTFPAIPITVPDVVEVDCASPDRVRFPSRGRRSSHGIVWSVASTRVHGPPSRPTPTQRRLLTMGWMTVR